MSTPSPALLDVEGAAAFTGMSRSFLNKARCLGGGPRFLKLGRSVRYDPDDLREWLAAYRRASTSEYGTEARHGRT